MTDRAALTDEDVAEILELVEDTPGHTVVLDWTYEAVTYYTANDTPAVPPFVHRPRTDPMNYAYAGHCIGSPYDWQPDCGHPTCGILCDVAIVANRRAEMADLCS